MKKIVLTLLISFIVLWNLLTLTSCSTKAMDKNLEANNSILSRYCSSCHKVPDPKSQSDDEWKATIKNHRSRINLTDAENNKILDYLLNSN